MKMVSPSVICLPPYIVLCAMNVNAAARGSITFAFMAYTMIDRCVLGRSAGAIQAD
jgi:hypothetical protein